MKQKYFIPYLLGLTFIVLFSNCSGQNKFKHIAGLYNDTFYIFEDGTFMARGMRRVIFGTVAMQNDTITLIKHQPKHKFVLYGRKDAAIKQGSTYAFQGFEHGGSISLVVDTQAPLVMQNVFNNDAACYRLPFFYEHPSLANTIYLANNNDIEVYKFDIPAGFKDFVVKRLEDDGSLYDDEMVAKVAADYNSITFINNNETLTKKQLPKQAITEMKMVMAKYERVYPSGKLHYETPAFNIFEEQGINLKQYQEIGQQGEGVLRLKGSNKKPNATKRVDWDFADTSIVYTYQRIEPKMVSTSFTVSEHTIFTFKCNTTE